MDVGHLGSQTRAKEKLSSDDGQLKKETVLAYRLRNKEVKSRCIFDKLQWIYAKPEEAEVAAKTGDSKTVYNLVKALSGKALQKLPLNCTDGKLLKSQQQ